MTAYESHERPTQSQLARRFGVTQQAIARRLASARAKRYGTRLDKPSRTMRLKAISLSFYRDP